MIPYRTPENPSNQVGLLQAISSFAYVDVSNVVVYNDRLCYNSQALSIR